MELGALRGQAASDLPPLEYMGHQQLFLGIQRVSGSQRPADFPPGDSDPRDQSQGTSEAQWSAESLAPYFCLFCALASGTPPAPMLPIAAVTPGARAPQTLELSASKL